MTNSWNSSEHPGRAECPGFKAVAPRHPDPTPALRNGGDGGGGGRLKNGRETLICIVKDRRVVTSCVE